VESEHWAADIKKKKHIGPQNAARVKSQLFGGEHPERID